MTIAWQRGLPLGGFVGEVGLSAGGVGGGDFPQDEVEDKVDFFPVRVVDLMKLSMGESAVYM
jgi:hypothetical protein